MWKKWLYWQTHEPNTPFLRPHSGANQDLGGTGSVARGPDHEIVPHSQEPAYKDRKWNPSTWYHSSVRPWGGIFQRDALDGSHSVPKTCLPGHVCKKRVPAKEGVCACVCVWRRVLSHCFVLSDEINTFHLAVSARCALSSTCSGAWEGNRCDLHGNRPVHIQHHGSESQRSRVSSSPRIYRNYYNHLGKSRRCRVCKSSFDSLVLHHVCPRWDNSVTINKYQESPEQLRRGSE